MCNSFKIKSLLHKLPLNRAAGKDRISAEHISYADSNQSKASRHFAQPSLSRLGEKTANTETSR